MLVGTHQLRLLFLNLHKIVDESGGNMRATQSVPAS